MKHVYVQPVHQSNCLLYLLLTFWRFFSLHSFRDPFCVLIDQTACISERLPEIEKRLQDASNGVEVPGDPGGALALHCIHQLNKQYDIKRLSEEDGAAGRDDNAEESLADLDAFTTALQNVRPAQTDALFFFFNRR
mgnify:CR=1 FL=1